MSTIKSLKNDELLLFAEELGLDIPQNPKIIVLKRLIESSEDFETDKEFLKSVIDGVLAEKNAKIEQEKFEVQGVADNRRLDGRRQGGQSDHRLHNQGGLQGGSRNGSFRGQNDQNGYLNF
ncbi:hypothetical protein TNCV_4626661 [Trichonephila clavipes]|nr:hypothetical protein TNCV_4626661 [Trichonephila clavipes]